MNSCHHSNIYFNLVFRVTIHAKLCKFKLIRSHILFNERNSTPNKSSFKSSLIFSKYSNLIKDVAFLLL